MGKRALSFVLVMVAACSSESSGGDVTGSSGSTGTGAPGATSARCVGKPVESTVMRDRASCSAQGADWSETYLECRGTTFVVNCARADQPSRPEEAQKAACLDMPGCGWTEADGSVTKPAGRCEGTKTACSSFKTKDECRSQPGCNFLTGDCEKSSSQFYLDNSDCAGLQIGTSVSFSVVRNACERAKGCTWVAE